MPIVNRTKNLEMLTESEAGYIAGFLDGEGTIMLQIKPRKEHHPNRIPFHFHPVLSFANNKDNLCELMTKKLGELRESLNSYEQGNPQPSRLNVIDIVERKVQRLMREDSQPIIATRAPGAKAKR